jgi:hypothetical protein
MSESVEPLELERCADCPGAAAPEPAHVLGPFIGVVGAVLCTLVGAFLLLAPYAFDYRDGSSAQPRSSVVDLVSGGGVALIGLLTAALFGGALLRRLRGPETYPPYPVEPASVALPGQEPARPEPAPEPVPASVQETSGQAPHDPSAASAPVADPGNALRDLLTPLVAALAADLRAREGDGEKEGNRL